ncbi:cell wall protein IFF5 [Melitaea cinxia]|uniref:cell wall protein IFF5 n=1 Tax=Melitaea cinxia TaxID=113334 RepID=UPI001E2724AF|nr:cell wall protein IFF5 [Melitaea cinxia]
MIRKPGLDDEILDKSKETLENRSPLPNVTSVDLGLKEGSCALGDVVYMPGDQLPGTSPCERCKCSDGVVECSKQTCEPRPGCKALHRPDHCCPTYQCECEQEGRIYGNGEKLVDPLDPCRVCYCQGGEVVCRRIACFVRDDCQPRLVPGRCCPEYDNCPVRDGTPLPSIVTSVPSVSIFDNIALSAISSAPSGLAKPEITIKEITPVSEIPVITDVKIKEILPSPSIEVAEYSSSKSPLITREASTERSSNNDNISVDTTESKDGLSSFVPVEPESTASEQSGTKAINDVTLSKVNLSTEDSSNDSNFQSKIPNIVSMMGVASISDSSSSTTKAAITEEEDLDHNPAFPPIPDDLFLVLSNHEEDILPEQALDNEHVPTDQEAVKASNVPISTQEPIFKESPATTVSYMLDIATITSESSPENLAETSTFKDATVSTQFPITKENPMLNMRSVIPTEILNIPSLISDDITGEMLDVTESSMSTVVDDESVATEISATDGSVKYIDSELQPKQEKPFSEVSFINSQTSNEMDETTNTMSKSTEIISETEFSSIPIETSDQNPHEVTEKENKDKLTAFTVNLIPTETSSTKPMFNEDESITMARSSEKENQSFENVETTEFILTSFGSQESSTDAVELIKVSSNDDKSSAIIESPNNKNSNVLTDLINLVGDVASISDHTEKPDSERHTSSATTISDSEELIPVNVAAGYKSKNKNYNVNSITEMPLKHKVPMMVSKQNVVEIEGDDDSDVITDSPPPNDKVEPTTRRPIIDNVSDTDNKTEVTDKRDIEIITKSYVPTLNRRPTKVIMKNNDEKLSSEESSSDDPVSTPEVTAEIASGPSDVTKEPELNISSSKEVTSTPEVVSSASEVKVSSDANESLESEESPAKEQSTESSNAATQ